MNRTLLLAPAALAALALLTSCNLELGSGTTTTEVDQVLADRVAAANAANQTAQAPAAASPATSSSTSSAPTASAARPATTTTASSSGGGGGFLWKPVSDSNGNLVVILPSQYNGKVSSVSVNGERGSFSGIANGNRTHWRFSKPGAAYGSNAKVVASTSGGNVTWTVPNGGSRTNL